MEEPLAMPQWFHSEWISSLYFLTVSTKKSMVVFPVLVICSDGCGSLMNRHLAPIISSSASPASRAIRKANGLSHTCKHQRLPTVFREGDGEKEKLMPIFFTLHRTSSNDISKSS